MANLEIRNRSLKISPGGIITLPLSARKALQMAPKKGARVTMAVDSEGVVLRQTSDQAGTRVSPKGQVLAVGSAREVLSSGADRHFWLRADDERREVTLLPFKS